jgi:hypothetical protein
VTETPPPVRDGRSLGWRLGALGLGALFAGAGLCLVLRPEFLAYGVAAVLCGLALLCIVSAVAARGR